MSPTLTLPGFLTAGLGIAAGHYRWRLSPRTALWLLGAIAAVAASATLLLLGITALGLIFSTPVAKAISAWRPNVPLHQFVTLATHVCAR